MTFTSDFWEEITPEPLLEYILDYPKNPGCNHHHKDHYFSSSNWIISPSTGKKENVSNHHLVFIWNPEQNLNMSKLHPGLEGV